MLTKYIKGYKFKVISPSEYELDGYDPVELKIFKGKNGWCLSVLQPEGKKWKVTMVEGFPTLKDAIDAFFLEQVEVDDYDDGPLM